MLNRAYEMPDWNGIGVDVEEPLLRNSDNSSSLRRPSNQYRDLHQGHAQQPRAAQLPQWLDHSMSSTSLGPSQRYERPAQERQYDQGAVAASFDFDVGGLAAQYLHANGLDGAAPSPPRIEDLDQFFSSMYDYYRTRGLPAILLNQFCSIATLGFTIAFSVFLLACVDWPTLRNCHDEASCGDFKSYVKTPFGQASFYNFITFCYMALFFVYWLFQVLSAIRTSLEGIRMESFYRRVLGISLSDLQNMQWSDIMRRLITLHDNGVYRVSIQDKLTEYDIVARIMRKENYMVALINKGVLDIRLPRWVVQCSAWEDGDKTLFLTKSLEWSINFCVLQFMFNENAVMTEEFLRDTKGLQYRFVQVGAIQLLFMPFMLVFMVIHFFLENAQQFRSSQSYLGPRQWSPLAMWMFREYNELPHTFEARLNRSYEGANKYVGLFTNGYAATLAKFVAYISGSFIAILLLVSVIDEAVLLYVRLSDHNLLWYLGIFSGIFAAAASFIPSQAHAQAAVGTAGSDYTRNKGSATRLQQMLNGTGMETTPAEQTMEVTAAQTHYFPRYWMHQCHTLHVRDEFLELFPYKTKLFAMEILSVLLTPLVLCFSLPNCVPDMLAFISRHTKYLDGVGDVCDYSTFDFDAYGNSDFLSPVDGDPNPKNGGYNFPSDARVGFINNMGSGIERQMINNNVIMRDRNSDGKLEQSYMSFRLANPGWTGGVSDPLSSQVPPVQNWISGKQSVGPSPLNNRMHTSGGGASISSSIRGGVEGLIPFANDIENGTPFSESIRNYDMTTAGDEMMQRIRAYRSHMAGEVSRSTGYSLTGSVRAISTASGIFPPVQDGKNLNPRHIPPLYPHPKYPIDGTRIAASTANYITDASYSPVESQLPSLTNIKNQVSRESTVSSVHDLYSGSKEEDEDCSDVEEVVAPITDNINYSLTPAEKEEHNRLFEECNNAQSFEYSQMSGVADVIDYSGLDRYSDGHDENRQALSIDDSIHNSIASILRSALKGEGGDIYENDFYWLNKYRSEKVRQSMMMSSSSVGSFRTAINGSIGESFAALYNNGSTSTHGSQSRHDVVSSRVISGSGRSAGSDAHQSSIAAELSARSRYSGSKVARTQSAGNPNFKSNLRESGRSYNSENGNSTPDEMASV